MLWNKIKVDVADFVLFNVIYLKKLWSAMCMSVCHN